MASSVHFLDRQGRVILGRDYRFDCSHLLLEIFVEKRLLGLDDHPGAAAAAAEAAEGLEDTSPAAQAPIQVVDGITYCYLTKPSFYCKGLPADPMPCPP